MNASHASLVAPSKLVEFAPGISWAVLPGDGMTLVYWVFEPPACGEVPMHEHVISQGGVVLEGSLTMHYADGTQTTMHPGDVYTLRSSAPHGVTFTERCVVVDVFAPNRVEYEERYAAGTHADSFQVLGATRV